MNQNKHRYSFLIFPLILLLDLLFVFILIYQLNYISKLPLSLALISFWLVTAYFTKYYKIDRITRPSKLLTKSLVQFFIFDLEVIAFYKLNSSNIPNDFLLSSLLNFNLFVLAFKLMTYVLIKYYRTTQHNLRNYIIVGYNEQTKEFQNLLSKRKDYGYKFKGFWSNEPGDLIEGNLPALDKYLNKANIDVIFCSLQNNTDEDINDLIRIADEHFVSLKFIPDTKQVLRYKHNLEFFDYFPVLAIQKSPLDKPENRFIKRSFDILFSLLVIVFILSWLYPLLWILIKLDSKGPAIFVQKRNGLNYEPFNCYKFRSMRPNSTAHTKQVSRDDDRITYIGRFIRKTSIDELPQFFNVLKGDMSIVGPRPHMIHENERFRKKVEKFMGRHYIKPGITGLAQVKGYRGEIVTEKDIINRIKYDLFYIENWSFWLDMKIIVYTIINLIKGEDKAY